MKRVLKSSSRSTHALRKRAERKLAAPEPRESLIVPRSPSPDLDAQRLMHELEVHQVELELQNEELRSARAELEIGLTRYQELFDFAPIGYAMLGPRMQFRALNHAAARLLGRQRQELSGTLFSRLVVQSDWPRLNVAYARAEQSGTQERVEVHLGNGKLVALTIAMLEGSRTLIALEDITQRRANEDRLADTEAALRLADKRKDEFLAMLSHELRNPLAPIRHCIFLLGHDMQEHVASSLDRAQRSLAIMERQVAHLARMIDDLLDVTRIGRGKIQLQKEPTELRSLVEQTLIDHRNSFETAKINLVAQLWPEPVWIEADPARITQVLSNVLGNAEKFTPAGGQVTVSLRCSGAGAELSISDTGAGIAPDILACVFEPFAQAPQTVDRSRGGLGLGLSMVKGLVELHGGNVSIHSPGMGQGTQVSIILPTTTPPRDSVVHQPARVIPLRRRVLVVEDNEDAADTLNHALTVVGHEVQVAYDGTSALECAREFHPEIVLCDIGLPGMDGYEVARSFREDSALRNAYLVALTGYARPEDLQQALEAGFNEHVAKPPSIERLNRLLARAPVKTLH